jgi:RHS repeat-associated protein
MLMPGRNGSNPDGGTGGGSGGNLLPANLTVSGRSLNTPLEYKATESIEFTNGFESSLTDVFTAFTNGSLGSGGSGSGGGGVDGSYRYGFNGKEKSDEIYENGNAYDFGERIQDPRLGRWFSLDPLMNKYPGETPYMYTGNNPILFIDPDGKDRIVTINLITNTGTYTLLQITTDKGVYKKVLNKLYISGGVEVNNYNIHETYTIDVSNNATANQVMNFKSSTEFSNKYSTNIVSYAADKLGMKDFNDPNAVANVQEFGFTLKGNGNGGKFDFYTDANHKEELDLTKLLGAIDGFKDISGQFPSVIDLLKKVKVSSGITQLLNKIEQVGNIESASEALDNAKPNPIKKTLHEPSKQVVRDPNSKKAVSWQMEHHDTIKSKNPSDPDTIRTIIYKKPK